MKSYLTNSKIFGLGPLWRPQGQKRPKKQVWLKMLRIVQFGEKSNKNFLPVIIFKANWRPTTLKTFGKMAFFLEKSIFQHKMKIISNYICYIFFWNEKTLLYWVILYPLMAEKVASKTQRICVSRISLKNNMLNNYFLQ